MRSLTRAAAWLWPAVLLVPAYKVLEHGCFAGPLVALTCSALAGLVLLYRNLLLEKHVWDREPLGMTPQGAWSFVRHLLYQNALVVLAPAVVAAVLYHVTDLDEALGILPLALLTALGLYLVTSLWFVQPQAHHIQGRRRLLSRKEAQEMADRKRRWGDPGIWWMGVRLPTRSAELHFAAVGATRSGKTTLSRALLGSEPVVPSIRKGKGVRLFAVDIQNEMAPVLRGINPGITLYSMSPFLHPDTPGVTVVGWDLAKDARTDAERDDVARLIIGDAPPGTESFFPEAARFLVSAVLHALFDACGTAWQLADVCRVLGNAVVLRGFLSSNPHVRSRLLFLAKGNEAAESVLMTVLVRFQDLSPVAACWLKVPKLSLRDWMEGESALLLGHDPTASSAIQAVNRTIFKRLSALVLSPANQRTSTTWFVLDELASLRLEGLSDLLTKGSHWQARCCLYFQSYADLRETLGENPTSAITGQPQNRGVFRLAELDSARIAAEDLGKQEFKVLNGQGQWELKDRQLVSADEIRSLPETSPETGLHAFGTSALLAGYAWKVELSGNEVERMLAPPCPHMGQAEPAPPENQRMPAFTEADMERLCLPEKVRRVLRKQAGPQQNVRPAPQPAPAPVVAPAPRPGSTLADTGGPLLPQGKRLVVRRKGRTG